mmetsp:Transcript_8550/g.17323  ORF Transcript_8550/g.17323 Transcript_8550/m.17323 type:complete len:151 (+) Transcript_8550:196-648(+)
MPSPMVEVSSGDNERVAIWQRVERRKIAGNAAPCRKNLADYLAKHPACEVYNGQDKVVQKRIHHPILPSGGFSAEGLPRIPNQPSLSQGVEPWFHQGMRGGGASPLHPWPFPGPRVLGSEQGQTWVPGGIPDSGVVGLGSPFSLANVSTE